MNAFTRHNVQEDFMITGVIELVTDRCDVVPILADYNVASYKIVDCDYKPQIMRRFEQIPMFYYEKEK